MSSSIANNAGTFYRAGFNFLYQGAGLSEDRVNLRALTPFVLPNCFVTGLGLLSSGDPFSQAVFDRSLTLTGFFTTLYWPPVKSGMDWRGGRHALQ